MTTTIRRSSGHPTMLCLALLMGTLAPGVDAQDNPCAEFAFVEPCGAGLCIDQTSDVTALNDALGCAVDAVADAAQPFNAINLGAGDFFLDPVLMDCPSGKWPCRFSGQSITNTEVVVNGDSISCDQQIQDGRIPAFLTATGSWTVGTMTISGTQSPCTEGVATEYALLFSGPAAVQDSGAAVARVRPAGAANACDDAPNGVVFSTANRIDIDGGDSAFNLGVGVAPNSAFVPGSCPTLLSGEFKCLRCDIRNVLGGIYIQVHAGTRVNVEKSDILPTNAGLIVFNSRASVNVFQTSIEGGSVADESFFGILVTREGEGAPDGLSVNVTESSLRLNAAGGEPAVGAGVFDFTGANSTVLLTVRGGEIEAEGSDALGVFTQDVNDAVVSGVRFLGNPFAGVIIGADRRDPVSGSAVVGNRLDGFMPDEFFTGFTPGTSGNVVCPHDFSGTLVSDLGDNFICEEGAAATMNRYRVPAPQDAVTVRQMVRLESLTSDLMYGQSVLRQRFLNYR